LSLCFSFNWALSQESVLGKWRYCLMYSDLGSRRRWVVSFKPLPLYPQGRAPDTQWIGCEGKRAWPVWGIFPGFGWRDWVKLWNPYEEWTFSMLWFKHGISRIWKWYGNHYTATTGYKLPVERDVYALVPETELLSFESLLFSLGIYNISSVPKTTYRSNWSQRLNRGLKWDYV